MKIRYLLSALLALSGLMAVAQSASDPMFMVLTMRNGEHKAVNIAAVDKLTFPTGKMNILHKDASSEQIAVNDIYNMEFSHSESGGVENVAVENSGIAYNATSSTLTFTGSDGEIFAMYNLKGELVLSFVTRDGVQTLDISELVKDIYVVSYNGQTLKIRK